MLSKIRVCVCPGRVCYLDYMGVVLESCIFTVTGFWFLVCYAATQLANQLH